MSGPPTAPANRGYVVSWRLAGRRVVVVGGGAVAEGKVEGLLDTGAHLVVVSPTLTPRLAELHRNGRFTWAQRRLRRGDVQRAALVVAATGDPTANVRAHRLARRAGALVNAVDDPERCDVTIPAVLRRGPATVAITTDGASPAAARFLREEIDNLLPADVGRLVELAAGARSELRRRGDYRYDYWAWRQRLFEPGWEALATHQPAALDELARRFVATFAGAPTPVRTGKVTLVGAGPGDPGLVTVRGAAALARADVVLYDRLVASDLLGVAPVAARRVPVGKGKGGGVDQEHIEALLVEHARAGAHVVRLKGGDPFVFGRGAEEVAAVAAAGIPVEVVPGLSSALAVPEVAGIPLTCRGVASSVAVVTGHRATARDPHWDDLARGADTIVVLMGVAMAAEVAEQLLRSGRSPTQPVAVVSSGTTPRQQVAVLELGALARQGCPLPAPAVLVIGDVVAMAASPRASPRAEETEAGGAVPASAALRQEVGPA